MTIEITALVDEGLGNSSYLVDLGDARALVVDPARDPGPFMATAAERGLSVAYSVETHLHADFVSGSRELAAQGAEVLAAAEGHVEFPHRGLKHGTEIDLGGITLRALATPGHTPEHLCYLLLDGSEPQALFSGGSLLVGAVARTDLIAPERSEDLARDLWRSLHATILTLPDELPVYPTHGAGSFCSAPVGSARTTTIGVEKSTNALLNAADEDTFVRLLIGGLGSYPSYFLGMRELNRRGPKIYGSDPPALAPLDAARVQNLMDDGAVIVDARPVASFAAGHIVGSVSIPLRDQFATWLGWLVDANRPVVFVLEREQDRAEVVRQAHKIGYESLIGELHGGIDAWTSARMNVGRIRLVSASAVSGTVIDIRQDSEFASGHIPGALHIELGSLTATDIPESEPITLMCGHGERAMSAASILEAAGRRDLAVVVGGPEEWAAANASPLETA